MRSSLLAFELDPGSFKGFLFQENAGLCLSKMFKCDLLVHIIPKNADIPYNADNADSVDNASLDNADSADNADRQF